MFQFHPSATEKCQKSPLDIDERKQSNKSSNSVKKGSMDQQNQPLTRHGGRVDVELCHIVAFATKADLQVKKLDDKKIQVHFEKPGCFWGAMTLTMSVKLICILELAIISILILQAPELLQTTSNHFYTTDDTFSNHTVAIFVFEIFVLLTCLFSILSVFYAILKTQAQFILPHLAWQVFYVFISTVLCTTFLILASFGKIFWPSAIVLVILIGIPAILEIWWLFTMVDFYRQILINQRINLRLRRDSQEALRNIFANGLLQFHNSRRKSSILS